MHIYPISVPTSTMQCRRVSSRIVAFLSPDSVSYYDAVNDKPHIPYPVPTPSQTIITAADTIPGNRLIASRHSIGRASATFGKGGKNVIEVVLLDESGNEVKGQFHDISDAAPGLDVEVNIARIISTPSAAFMLAAPFHSVIAVDMESLNITFYRNCFVNPFRFCSQNSLIVSVKSGVDDQDECFVVHCIKDSIIESTWTIDIDPEYRIVDFSVGADTLGTLIEVSHEGRRIRHVDFSKGSTLEYVTPDGREQGVTRWGNDLVFLCDDGLIENVASRKPLCSIEDINAMETGSIHSSSILPQPIFFSRLTNKCWVLPVRS